MQQLTSLTNQRGASVTTIIVGLAMAGIIIKLGLGIIPAYIGDYQFTKLVAGELKKANDAKQTERQFMQNLSQQLSINANYNTKPEEMLIFTNKTPGALAVKSQYEVESNFYGETFIVNRFEKDITAADAK
ncbi:MULTISPECIES: DUF4845 domain-containing protein [Moraxella]|uniref:DUF4845 domain-containing protein n=1 Tax=Moraxella lacunata TaxID=477 RepID=A0A1B8Q580_MORLA|nr:MULTISPECIES: DUF4845 domain-containing protein [Moraxella]MBE9577906.1 DUF4845 domain-containing protein [Moraxella sp. K1664]MBE9587328.1 DUF4845 domain-containing protein [Moraxella sp. K1630]MBE9595520.1 DUF4845 domain-containing protein [Moraxella sp. K2450]MDH9218188.1 DUF4845 domain-containing protein [Moraxella lacunata]MDI4481944.1 DUF4845 domain-containing protein [Moraxella lacunata]